MNGDVQNLALVAWKEARGQGPFGCQAVMHVCKNRVGKPGFAPTLYGVIYGKNQFTSMSVLSDPEFFLEPKPDDVMYQACLTMAPQVLDGTLPDNTNGALYYANLRHIDQNGWFARNIIDKYPVVATIGNHTFYGPLYNSEEVSDAAVGEA